MVVIQFDNKYFKWGILFAKSLIHFNPNIILYIDSVNLDNNQILRLQKISSGIIIKNSIIKFLDVSISNFMANRKANVLLDVMKNYQSDFYLLCDVDFLIRKSLKELFLLSSEFDISCVFRNGKWKGEIYEHLKIASGLILVKSNAIDFVYKWVNLINESEEIYGIQKGFWYWDQITLLEATRQCNMKYLPLNDEFFINKRFNQSATIWSAHKSPKDYMYYIFLADFQVNKNKGRPIMYLISNLIIKPIYIFIARFIYLKYQINKLINKIVTWSYNSRNEKGRK